MLYDSIIKKSPIYILILIILPTICLGQIATPSIDSTLLIDMPAATGWRYTSTIGASIIDGSGTENEGEKDEKSITWRELSYLIASKIVGDFYTEAFTAQQRKSIKDQNKNESENYEENRNQVNFAFRYQDNISLGAGYFSSVNKLDSNASDTFYNEVKDEQTGYSFGASINFAKQFYVSYGMEQTEEKSSKQSGQVKVSTTKWVDTMYGIAIVEDSNNPNYRIEYSRINSPEEESEDGNSIHYASTDTRIAVEYVVKQYEALLRYEKRQQVITISDSEELEKEFDSFGLVKINSKGWNYGLYYITGTETTAFSSSASDESQTATVTYYRANIAYNF